MPSRPKRIRLRPMCRLLALLLGILLLPGQPAQAGGAWPRGKGNGFLSVTWSTFGDAVGYVKELSGPLLEKPELELTNEIGVYAEYGITERLTFGVDRFQQPEPEPGIGATILFLRSALGNLDWSNHYGVEIGFGPVRDWRGEDDTVIRAGFSVGRGYSSRWGDGWLELDSKFGQQLEVQEQFWKIDGTMGWNATDASFVSLQLQSGAAGDGPVYMRAVPAYVRRFDHGISVESALLLGVQNDEAQGVKLGAWLDF